MKTMNKERKRADALLNQMLPKAVADKLKKNQEVLAESYETTSIFFSDIVGFSGNFSIYIFCW